eukprot:UN11130
MSNVFASECTFIPSYSVLHGNECGNMTNVTLGVFPIPAYADSKIICHTNVDNMNKKTNIYSIQCKSKDSCTYNEYNYNNNVPLNCNGNITRMCSIDLGGYITKTSDQHLTHNVLD